MLVRDPCSGQSATNFAYGDINRALPLRHTPRQNQLLAALAVEDYERLRPHMVPVPLPLGWTVHDAGARERHLYFLTSGIVSRFYVTEDGASAESSLTGNEGVIGIASFLGGGSTPSQAAVLSPGYSYRLRADLLKSEFAHGGPLPHLLLHYTQALIVQTGQIAACNRYHSLEQRLCRWILSCLDRLSSNEMAITQEMIANMLGVRRVGVTEVAGRLQEAGLIHCGRGHLAVLDRRRMEARACECYAAIKRAYGHTLSAEEPDGTARIRAPRRASTAPYRDVRPPPT